MHVLTVNGNDATLIGGGGSSQSVTLDDWFAAAHHELAAITTSDGGVLENGEVGALVTAMAASSPFYNTSSPTMQNALAAAWDA